MNLITIVAMVVVFGGVFVYYKFFASKSSGKFNEAYTEAQQEFNADKEKIKADYFSDSDRFKILNDVVGDEKIL